LWYVFLQAHALQVCSHFFQGPTVQGEVSLTCDAWQANNTDAYFAVTAHWIEEPTPAKWELKNALIGFTGLNNAHNGERLGQALFKVIKRVGIENKVSVSYIIDALLRLSSTLKVGHVTCDNASNNRTMMKELAARLEGTTGKEYTWEKRKIKSVGYQSCSYHLLMNNSCLANVDPKKPDAHMPTSRDEVGLVRATVVKVCIMS